MHWLRTYQREDVRADAFAALTVTGLLVPHGMAYAELAGVPGVNGLYATVVALLVYAAVGPSRLLMVGPDSSLAPLIAAAIALVGAQTNPENAVSAAAILAVLTGGVCILAGLSRLGTMAELLSKPVRVGYLNGVAIVMIISQLPQLVGVSADGGTAVARLADLGSEVADSGVDSDTLVLGLACLAVIALVRWAAPRWPGVLVAVVAATIAVVVFDLSDSGVAVLGEVPNGFPRPGLELPSRSDLLTLLAPAVGLAFLTLSDTTALSRGFAARHNSPVDANREVVALGVVNIATGMFSGLPVSASTTRTTLAEASGGRSQVVGIVGASAVLALLVAGSGLMANLPLTALAAIVIAAGVRLFDHRSVLWMMRVRPSEFALAMSATVGVVAIGVLEGIIVAIILSLGNFVRTVWRPHDAILARVDGRSGYHDTGRHPAGERVPGLLLFRFDAPLFFANADHFARRLRAAIDASDERPRAVVVGGEAIADIDTTGAEVLGWLLDDLDEMRVGLAFAGLKGPVKDRLKRYGIYDRIGDANFHSTFGSAIASFDLSGPTSTKPTPGQDHDGEPRA